MLMSNGNSYFAIYNGRWIFSSLWRGAASSTWCLRFDFYSGYKSFGRSIHNDSIRRSQFSLSVSYTHSFRLFL